jgi:hypothetical protein
LLVAVLASGSVSSRADVFVLQNGGRIHGTLPGGSGQGDRREQPQQYEITTVQGGRLVLHASQVRQVIREDAEVVEYQQLASRQPDTIEGHWQVADWCRQKGLKDQREFHLRRILQIDPDHAGARYGLGYSQVRGEWVTREEILRRRGYEPHDGRWQLPQETQLQEEKQTLERAERHWFTTLRRWRDALATNEAAQAYKNIAAVNDPHAVKALGGLLRTEPYRHVKLLYIEVLARIGNAAAVGTLVDATLQDPDEEIYHACLDQIVRLRPPHVTLRYVEALKDQNNLRLNRAGYALGRLHDKSVISPLIDALQTTHCVVIPKKSDHYQATFVTPTGTGKAGTPAAIAPGSPLGGTSFSAGDETKVIPVTVTNQQVLEALIRLSGGANFGFDQQAWRFWLAAENRKAVPDVSGRREKD